MRNAATALAASLLLGLGVPAREASAGATVDLLFVGQNGAPIAATAEVTASPGDLLTMALVMRNDEPLTIAAFSLAYDLDGANELDVVSAVQWVGLVIARATSFSPLGSLTPISSTFVGTFHGATSYIGGLILGHLPRTLPPASGTFAGGYQMGTVVWRVNAGVNTDGTDIISGILNPALDILADAGFNDISNLVLGNSASVNAAVNAVPEPGTAALLGLGFLGLTWATRRRPPR